ncbi:MAG: cation diffusion facilitator family transporter [Minisyncoccia bacterium]
MKRIGCWCEVQRYALVLAVCLLVFFIQVVGGYVAGSVAVLADSAHVASDTASTGLSLIIATLARTHHDEHGLRDFWSRVSAFLLFLVLAWIAWEAVERLCSPQEVDGQLVVAVASAGLLGNLIQYRLLYREKTSTGRVQRLHILQDLASSAAVVVGGVCVWAFGWSAIDPWLSLGIVAFMIPAALLRTFGKADAHHGHHH